MKVLKCPKCGKEFLDETCPVCGCSANECSIVEQIEKPYENNETSEIRTECKFPFIHTVC